MKRELNELLAEVKTNQEKYIVERLIENYEQIPQMKLCDVADISYCSKTSVRRVIIKLGYKGYLEFQLNVKINLINEERNRNFEGYNQSRNDIVQMIEFFKTSNHFYIYGAGADSLCAQYLFRLLLEAKYSVTWINDENLLSQISDEALVVVSNSGRDTKLIDKLEMMRNENSCKIAAITKEDSALAEIVDASVGHYFENSINSEDQIDTFIIISQLAKLLSDEINN